MRFFCLFLFLSLSLSCSNQNCRNDDLAVQFDMLIKLVSETGENLLDNPNFSLENLKIGNTKRQSYLSDRDVIVNEGERIIVFTPGFKRKLIFIYNDVTVGAFEIIDVVQFMENCIVKTQSYKIVSKNKTVCECNIEDVFSIELTI